MPLPPELKGSLRRFREVRSRGPGEPVDPVAFANWREEMANALDSLARHLLFESDRVQATASANAAREEAASIRAAVNRTPAGHDKDGS